MSWERGTGVEASAKTREDFDGKVAQARADMLKALEQQKLGLHKIRKVDQVELEVKRLEKTAALEYDTAQKKT